MTKLLDADVFY